MKSKPAATPVGWSYLAGVPVAIPPIDVQRRIADDLDELSAQTNRLAEIGARKLAALAELQASLLRRAFTGHLTLSKKVIGTQSLRTKAEIADYVLVYRNTKLAVVEANARAFGFECICLDSAPFMRSAQRMYEARGFVDRRSTRARRFRSPSYRVGAPLKWHSADGIDRGASMY
jgi:hypothetical protein